MAEEDTEYLKLPLEERCVHKSWKARVHGYEEATKLFNQWDGDDQNWKKFLGLIKKFVTDSNAVAQEKGLEAALAFAENCDLAGKTVNECVDGLVNKCLAAPKTKTKDLAKQIILMYCEIEQHEKVIEELIKGLAQKNPKTVSGCINNMTDCLKAFGAKVIKVSPLLKAVVPLLDHRDKAVRDEGKLLIVEAYRWVGEIMKQQLTGCKPVQMTELEAEFEKLKGEKKARPERLLRSQQQIVASPEDEGDGAGDGAKGGDGDEEEADDDTDPYDLMDPVDILEKLPKNFYELVEEKKWQLRKEALDALLPLSQNPKLAPGDYNDLIRVLKKFIAKDANVMLVALAAQCLAGLAKGLRTGFKNGATQCFATVLEKFKEKKANVVSALVEAVDAMYPCLGIEAVQEDCLEALKHKTPTVNSETAKFLTRAFAKCPAPVFTNKKMVKGYVSCLLERLNHSDPIVRDAASETLGMLVKLIGEPSMTKLMPDLDPIKMAKIKEFADKAEITGKRPKLQPEGGNAPPAKGGAKVVKPGGPQKKPATGVRPGAAKPKAVAKPPPPPQSSDDEEDNYEAEFAPPPKPAAAKPAATSRVGSAPARKTSAPTAAARQRPGTSVGSGAARPGAAASAAASKKKGDDIDPSPPYVVSNLKNIRFKDETKFKLLKWNFATPRPEFVDQLKEQMTNANFNKTLMSQMFHTDFKQHLKAIETLAAYIDSDLEGLISNLDLILKWTTLRFFETNPSVLLRALDYLNDAFSALADDSYSLHDIEAVSFIPYLVNKVGDPKDQVRNSIRNILRSLRNVYPVSKLLPFLMDGLKSKNGKQRSECLDDLGSIIRDYGMGVLQPSAAVCLKEMAKFIGERDTSVRNAALNAVTEAFFQTGEKLYKMIGNLPEKDMSMLEERIKRVSLTRPPPGSGGPPPPAAVAAPAPQPVLPSQEPRTGIPANRNRNIPAPPGGLSGLKRYQPQQAPQQQQPQQQPELPSNARRTSPQAGNGGMFGRDRPVSGVFSLDLEKIETSGDGYHHHSNHRISNGGPKLVAHNLDEIFGEDGSCRLPPTMSSARNNLMSGGGVRDHHHLYQPQAHHQQQAPQRNLIDSPEAYEALDLVLSQVMSKDATLCTTALAQLDELIKDKEKVVLLGERMDQLLISCYMQYRHVLNNKLRTDNANPKEVLRLFQYVTMVLMAIYQHPNLTKNGSTSNLQDLLNVIVCILLEPDVHHMPDGSQLVRALNVLTVKMIDRSDHTAVTCAFLRLLKDTVGNSSLSQDFTEMVMKCLWRVIKTLPKWMEEEGESSVNLDDVLADVHEFLKTYPSTYWRKKDNDTPARTVKTLLHTLVKTRGDEVLDHVTRVQDPQNSELVSYIRKLLKSGLGKENANVVRNNDNEEGADDLGAKNGNVRSGIPTIGSSGIPRFSKGDEESLKDIFKRIGQKETTKQGLQDLYNFKQRNPHADKQLEPFLAKSSDYFRNYIERGLKSIENEASASSHNILSESGQRNSDNNSAGVGGASDAYAPKLYLDRLKMLRAQAGLDSGSASSMSSGIGMSSCMTSTSASVTSEEEISSSTSSTLTTATTQATEIEVKPLASGNLDDIQKRLARLKQSAR